MASAALTRETSKAVVAKLIQLGLYSREIRKKTVSESKKVAEVRLRPTRLSFLSKRKNTESMAGMSSRRLARPKRTLATRSSPATPASARTGSGRDQKDAGRFLKVRFIFDLRRVAQTLFPKRNRGRTYTNLRPSIEGSGPAGQLGLQRAHQEDKV